MRQRLRHSRHVWRRLVRWLLSWFSLPARVRWKHRYAPSPRPAFAQPKPKWVKQEVIRLKAVMPRAGCRTLAHHFNRQWAGRRQMTVSKTYVAEVCRRHQYLILEARRKLKHRIPHPMPRNRVWGCDLLVKTDQQGQPHVALAILDHASRACLRLQHLSDKGSWRLLHEVVQTVKTYGRPQVVRTDNEAVMTSRVFRHGLWLLRIRHQRIVPGCPWQNGRVERFIGTVKRAFEQEALRDGRDLDRMLIEIRRWYNQERPHDHLHGRTPAEVWAGIDVFARRSG